MSEAIAMHPAPSIGATERSHAVGFALAATAAGSVLGVDSRALPFLAALLVTIWCLSHSRRSRQQWSDLGLRLAAAAALGFAGLLAAIVLTRQATPIEADVEFVTAGWPWTATLGHFVVPAGVISEFRALPGFGGPRIEGNGALAADYTFCFAVALALLWPLRRASLLALTGVTRWYPLVLLFAHGMLGPRLATY